MGQVRFVEDNLLKNWSDMVCKITKNTLQNFVKDITLF